MVVVVGVTLGGGQQTFNNSITLFKKCVTVPVVSPMYVKHFSSALIIALNISSFSNSLPLNTIGPFT